MRINRFLSSCGVGSRRKSEKFVKEGRVKVNGKILSNLAYRVAPDDKVELDGKIISPLEPVFYLFNKPRFTMVSHYDPHCKDLIFDYLPDDQGLFAVGRLDFDSEGLIFITNQGKLAERIAHPSYEMEKEYWVLLDRPFDPNLSQRAKEGIQGPKDFYQVDDIEIIKDGSEAKERMKLTGNVVPGSLVKVILHEGKKREVRRIFDSLGYQVLRLFRERIGPISVAKLPPGSYRKISSREWDALLSYGENS